MNTKIFIVNVEAVIYKDDKWLMIRRSEKESHAGGTISFVGGKVENAGNSYDILEATLKREIKEEIDIEIEDFMQYIASSSFIADNGDPVIDIVLLCKYKSGESKAVNSDEVADIFWMTAEEILNHPKAIDWTKHVIKLIKSNV